MGYGTVFLHPDLDGRCAAAIARMAYPELYPVNGHYAGSPAWEKLHYGDRIVVVDMRFSPEIMIRLFKNYKLIHIDHHLPSAEELAILKEANYDPAGIRPTTEVFTKSAALLAWEYFFKDKPVPQIVKFVSDYDTWTFAYPDTLAVFYGMESLDHTVRNVELWTKLLEDDPTTLNFVKLRGQELLAYVQMHNETACKDLAYETTLFDYPVLAANIRTGNSTFFDSMMNKGRHDFLLMYSYIGGVGEYRCSLYPTRPELDANRLAQQFGGGGHAGAAGFTCKTLPFKQVGSLQPKMLVYDNIYQPLEDYLAGSTVARMYIRNQQRIAMMSQHFITEFEGHTCMAINSASTSVELFLALNTSAYPIAIAYVWTNLGKYRVIVHPLMKVANLDALCEKYKGTIVAGSLWFYCDEVPIQLTKRIK